MQRTGLLCGNIVAEMSSLQRNVFHRKGSDIVAFGISKPCVSQRREYFLPFANGNHEYCWFYVRSMGRDAAFGAIALHFLRLPLLIRAVFR
jgi:hypothetical protein